MSAKLGVLFSTISNVLRKIYKPLPYRVTSLQQTLQHVWFPGLACAEQIFPGMRHFSTQLLSLIPWEMHLPHGWRFHWAKRKHIRLRALSWCGRSIDDFREVFKLCVMLKTNISGFFFSKETLNGKNWTRALRYFEMLEVLGLPGSLTSQQDDALPQYAMNLQI